VTGEQTFLFADLAGFTALTEAHGDDRAADLVADFATRTRGLLSAYRAEEVKLIGDALMLRSEEAADGVGLACRIVADIGGQHGFPAVRVGVHSGPAVQRDADWFGATVNTASRIAAAAAAGEVLISADTRGMVGDRLPGCAFRLVGTRRFKNVRDPVELYSVVDSELAAGARGGLVIDPVCRMAVDPQASDIQRSYQGRSFAFCSSACAEAFESAPDRYAQRGSRADLRVSEASRDRAATFLRRAYEQGRLELDELDERLAHVMVAKTRRELSAPVTDLPGHRRLRRPRGRWWRRFTRRRPR